MVAALVAVAVLVLAGAAVAVFFLVHDHAAATPLTEEEARSRVAASLEAVNGAFDGDDPANGLSKADAQITEPTGGEAGPFGGFGGGHLTIEWGRDGARQMKVDGSNGPVSVSFTMTCTKDRLAVEFGAQAFVSRPYVDGVPDCMDPFGDGSEEDLESGSPLDVLQDLDSVEVTVNDDGTVHAVGSQNGTTVEIDLDAQGRMTSLKATGLEEGTWTMTLEYGSRRTISLPSGAKLMPATVDSTLTPSGGGRQGYEVKSSPQRPPLSEMEIHVVPYDSYGFGDDGGDGSDAGVLPGTVVFPADVAGPQVQGNYTVQYRDADGDGKVSPLDTWEVMDASVAGDPYGFPSMHAVLYDEVAKGEANGNPVGMPGLGWLPVAGLALGLALLRRR
jgi:hypothetical protein